MMQTYFKPNENVCATCKCWKYEAHMHYMTGVKSVYIPMYKQADCSKKYKSTFANFSCDYWQQKY